MHFSTIRILIGATLVAASTVASLSARGAGETPLPVIPIPEPPASKASVSPTVPAPMPATGPHIRFHDLVRSGKAGDVEKPGNGDKTAVEAGPELSLGECIAVAI